MPSLLSFPPLPPHADGNRRTTVYDVRHNIYFVSMGVVKFHPPTRRYTLQPTKSSLFSVQALQEVINFINGLTDDRQKKREEREGCTSWNKFKD